MHHHAGCAPAAATLSVCVTGPPALACPILPLFHRRYALYALLCNTSSSKAAAAKWQHCQPGVLMVPTSRAAVSFLSPDTPILPCCQLVQLLPALAALPVLACVTSCWPLTRPTYENTRHTNCGAVCAPSLHALLPAAQLLLAYLASC
jgi:hypothetical protein